MNYILLFRQMLMQHESFSRHHPSDILLKSAKKNDGSGSKKITRLESEGSKVVIGGRDGNSRNYAAGGDGIRTGLAHNF